MTIYHIDAVDPDEANSSHALVLELAGEGVGVLDVGCATGYLGAALTERGCTVVGVEVDPVAAEQARAHLSEVVVADLERELLDEVLPGRTFDLVVLADVLEHLRDPLTVLRSAVRVLAPGGAVVVSVPNVTHGSLRLALLQGRWEYRDTGLLDRTHLRFFTKESLLRLLEDAGLAPTDLRSTVLDPLATEVAVDGDSLPGAVADWVRRQEDALTYQFVVRAVPSEVRGRVPEVVPAVTPPRVTDIHTERAEREVVLAQTAGRTEELLEQVLDLRRRVMTARDHAIGTDAALGLARHELEAARAEAAAARAAAEEATALRAEVDRLRDKYHDAVRELTQAKGSATWRVGRLALRPVTLARRVVGS